MSEKGFHHIALDVQVARHAGRPVKDAQLHLRVWAESAASAIALATSELGGRLSVIGAHAVDAPSQEQTDG